MRRNLLVSFASTLALLMVAVSSGSRAVAAETITMVTTGKGSAQEWPIFIAEAKGFMAENGVAPDLIAAPSTAAAMQQLAAQIGGRLDSWLGPQRIRRHLRFNAQQRNLRAFIDRPQRIGQAA